jgi:hypothetical protein
MIRLPVRVLLRIIKNASASTSTVGNVAKARAEHRAGRGTPGLVIKSLFDQSVLVVPHPTPAE